MFLTEAAETLDQWEKACLDALGGAETEGSFALLFRLAHNTKGSSQSVGLSTFGAFVHEIENLIKALRDDLDFRAKIENWPEVFLESHSILKSWLSELDAKTIGISDEPAISKEHVKRIQSLLRQFAHDVPQQKEPIKADPEDSIVFDLDQLAQHSARKESKAPPNLDLSPKESAKPDVPQKSNTEQTALKVRPEDIEILCENLEGVITDFQEMSLGILQNLSPDDALVKSFQFRKIERALFQSLEAAQMFMDQTPETFAQRLQRAALDLASKQGKKIVFKADGLTQRLRANVLSEFVTAFTHMVRNSVDHGIETPDQRLAAGKSEQANLRLTVKSSGLGATIEVSDDGKGLNRERILSTAVTKGLIQAGQKESMTDSEVWNLIFLPGFSTNSEVTDVSGRGVGMDVVLTAVKQFNGTISVNSQAGQGSSFRVFIPSPSATQKCLLLECKGAQYGVPERPALRMGDRLYPVFSLLELFPVGTDLQKKGTENYAFLVDEKDARYCVSFGEVLGIENVVLKRLSPNMKKLKSVSGITQRPNGDLIYILNPEEWPQQINNTGVGRAA